MNKVAKKCITIFFVISCIALICYGVYAITSNISTVSTGNKATEKSDKTEETSNDKGILIASLPEDDFTLYKKDDRLVLQHKGQSKIFEWTGYFTENLTKMAYADYNGDGKKEVAIVITQDGTNGKTTSQLHVLSVLETSDSIEYQDTSFVSNTIMRDVEIGENFDAVQAENKKRVSFTLGETACYFQAPSKEDGTYYSFLAMSIGSCSFDISDGKITSTIELSASFDGISEEVIPGNIRSNITFSDEQYQYSGNSFVPAKGFGISEPVVGSVPPYSVKATNADPKSSTDLALDNITFTIDPGNTANRNFDAGASDERYLSSIEITESFIRLALKDNMKFDSFWIENSQVLLWMGSEQEGYFIHRNSEITHEKGYYYLTTYFDEVIPRQNLKQIIYSYGATTQ